jgi:probable HAF family extracellular repeat protein
MRTRSLLRSLLFSCMSLALTAPLANAAPAPAAPRPQFGSDRVLPALSFLDADQYTAHALAMPAKAFSGNASAVNLNNIAVGWYQTRAGSFAVSWDPAGNRTELGALPGLPSSLANGINDSGAIVGFAFTNDFLSSRAFVWHAGSGMQALADLGGNASLAQAINASGTIVGWADDAIGAIHAVRWDASGKITDLNPPGAVSEALGINDKGDIVGWVFAADASAAHAWLWRHDGVQIDLQTLGGASSQANAVNNALVVVGVSDRRVGQPVAFVWTPAKGMQNLGFGSSSQALAISDRGRAGGSRVGEGVFALTRTLATKTQVLPDVNPTSTPFSAVDGMNLCGTLVGSSSSPDPTNGNPVPARWTKTDCD